MGLGQLQVAAGEDDVGAVDAATLKRQAWYASLVWKGGPALDQNPALRATDGTTVKIGEDDTERAEVDAWQLRSAIDSLHVDKRCSCVLEQPHEAVAFRRALRGSCHVYELTNMEITPQ